MGEETVAKEDGEAAEKAIKDAQIAACLVKKDYGEALTLALDLGKIGELRKILEMWAYDGLTRDVSDEDDQHQSELLKEWVDDLTVEQRETLIKDILVKWITNRRTSQIANLLLRYCLPYMGDKSMEGMNVITDAFNAYGERHLSRWQAMCQQTFIVDVILQSTNNSLPQAVADTAKVLFENADLSPRNVRTLKNDHNAKKIKSVFTSETDIEPKKKKKKLKDSKGTITPVLSCNETLVPLIDICKKKDNTTMIQEIEKEEKLKKEKKRKNIEDEALSNEMIEDEKIENIEPKKKKKKKIKLTKEENKDIEKNIEENINSEIHKNEMLKEPMKKKKKKIIDDENINPEIN